MRLLIVVALALAWCAPLSASWYWPFGSDDDKKTPPRMSELMEKATELIDEAADLAADGKVDKSVETYRKALAELDRVEAENPERAKTSEFATLRNKRAYVNAAIDSMLLSQVKTFARAVAVSDTTELERKLAEERAAAKTNKVAKATKPKAAKTEAKDEKAEAKDAKPETKDTKPEVKQESKPEAKPVKEKIPEKQVAKKPLTKRDQIIECISNRNFDEAAKLIEELLAEKPNNDVALNLKAAMLAEKGENKAAESVLDQAISSNPRSYFAYYNMADLMLKQTPPNRDGAKRYYETGRAFGGPRDERIEEALK